MTADLDLLRRQEAAVSRFCVLRDWYDHLIRGRVRRMCRADMKDVRRLEVVHKSGRLPFYISGLGRVNDRSLYLRVTWEDVANVLQTGVHFVYQHGAFFDPMLDTGGFVPATAQWVEERLMDGPQFAPYVRLLDAEGVANGTSVAFAHGSPYLSVRYENLPECLRV